MGKLQSSSHPRRLVDSRSVTEWIGFAVSLSLLALLFLPSSALAVEIGDGGGDPGSGTTDGSQALEQVSVTSAGSGGGGDSHAASISDDGKVIGFTSSADLGEEPGFQFWRINPDDAFVRNLQTKETVQASLNSAGEPGNDWSELTSLSGDGRFAALDSGAGNLVGHSFGSMLYVRDLQTGSTTQVPRHLVLDTGEVPYGSTVGGSLSEHGRYLAFSAITPTQAPGDNSEKRVMDAFVYDRATGATETVSVSNSGDAGNGDSWASSISADGRSVAFVSDASNLVSGDTNGKRDVFIRQLDTGRTIRASVGSDGTESNAGSGFPSLSGDGSKVAFQSEADNLVGNDDNGMRDVFVHDVDSGETHLVSLAEDGSRLGNGGSIASMQALSSSGKYAAFAKGMASATCVRDLEAQTTNCKPVEGSTNSISGNGRVVSLMSGGNVFVLRFGDNRDDAAVDEWRGGIHVANYVAMGDSFSSGQGTRSYYSDTHSDNYDDCRRSSLAYATRLVDAGFAPHRLDFNACSGATIPDVYSGQWGEGSQLTDLNADTELVTISVGGDDLVLESVAKDCEFHWSGGCEPVMGDVVRSRLSVISSPSNAELGPGLSPLQRLFGDIRFAAPNADVLTMGYARPFPYATGADLFRILRAGACQGIRPSDQVWFAFTLYELDEAIRQAALSMGDRYVDMFDASDGHELCNPTGSPDFYNGISYPLEESFHPSTFGYMTLANKLAEAITGSPVTTYTMSQGQTVTSTFDVTGGSPLSLSTSWPGSDVVMSLTSPSGRVIDRSVTSNDVLHRVGPTDELYYLANPEAGLWTVTLYGADVAPGGEKVTLSEYQPPPPNDDPSASLDLSRNGRTIVVNGSASHDSDGSVVNYLWDFGDGSTASGSQATHTYSEPGTYTVTLIAQDDRGGLGFATSHEIDLRYTFQGFYGPVNNQPTFNRVKAGLAIPVQFGLGDAWGLNIFAPGSPEVQHIDCVTGSLLDDIEQTVAAGRSNLSFNAKTGTYNYVWKTDPALAGTCQRLILDFKDGSRREADFIFR